MCVCVCVYCQDGRHPDVCSLHSGLNFVNIQSIFSHMDAALQYSTYVFAIITERSCHDSWAGLQRDEALMESISNSEKRWSVTDRPAQ